MSEMSRGVRGLILVLSILISTVILLGVFFVGTLITVFTFDNPSRTTNPEHILNLEIIGLVLVGIGSWILVGFKLFPPEKPSRVPLRIGLSGIITGGLCFTAGILMALSFS